MKFYRIIIFLSFFFSILSCKKPKYEENGPVSLSSVNSRLRREWQMDKILINGVDSTFILNIDSLKIPTFYKFLKINKDGDYPFKIGFTSGNYIEIPDSLRFKDVFYHYYSSTTAEEPLVMVAVNHWKFIKYGFYKSYGPIGFFSYSQEWKIKKLTKKEFHINTTYNNTPYDVYFKSTY